MKALVKEKAEPGLWLQDVPEPEIGPGDVLIKVLRTGICGTDLHIRDWDGWAQQADRTPLVLGHEFVGEVAEVGADVADIKRRRPRQRRGPPGLRQVPQLPGRPPPPVPHTRSASASAATAPSPSTWRCPPPTSGCTGPSVDLDVAAIFDPFGNAVHTALSFPLVGEDVLITGAGPIGIMAAAVARHAGARNVVITDVSRVPAGTRPQGRRQPARSTCAETPSPTAQRELGMREGFDVGLEMSGTPRGPARHDRQHDARRPDRACSACPPRSSPIDWARSSSTMITIKGIYGREMFETWYAMSVLLEGGLDITPVITHRYGYRDFEAAFDDAASGRCGKVVLDWTA